MYKSRNTKMLTIIALVLVITGLGIGFAAFSSTLNISSSAAVTPSSSDFNIVLSSSQYAVTTNDATGTVVSGIGTNGAQGGIINLYRKEATGLIAQFTSPGQSLTTTIYAHNIGEYDAYLRGVTITSINGNSYKKCVGATDATDALVQSACNGIDISVTINGIEYALGNTSISKHVIKKGAVEPIIITISYDSNASRADGEFDIEFGDLALEYSTVDGSGLLSFTIANNTYYFEEGMTWSEWLDSEYNTEGAWYDGGMCFETGSITTAYGGDEDDTILAKEYISNGNCPDLGWLKEY